MRLLLVLTVLVSAALLPAVVALDCSAGQYNDAGTCKRCGTGTDDTSECTSLSEDARDHTSWRTDPPTPSQLATLSQACGTAN